MALFGLIPDVPDKGVTLRLSAEQAKKEATGRALIMVGSTIGLIGSAMVLTVNPAVKQEAQGIWRAMPKQVRENKAFALVGAGAVIAGVLAWQLQRKNTQRYGT